MQAVLLRSHSSRTHEAGDGGGSKGISRWENEQKCSRFFFDIFEDACELETKQWVSFTLVGLESD
jgi:hypothetical protein